MGIKEQLKKIWKRFWFILWKDDSLKGWLLSILFLFIFVKFIFFPTLSLLTGTELPLAIVESCSMYHGDNLLSNYDEWWQKHELKYMGVDIKKEQFENFAFKKGFNKGDILFIIGVDPGELKVGDVIIFQGGQRNPLIHRITKVRYEDGKYFFSTMGDNNNGQLSVEKNISEEQLMGKAVLRLVPYAGWGKLIFYEYLKPQTEKGFCEEN